MRWTTTNHISNHLNFGMFSFFHLTDHLHFVDHRYNGEMTDPPSAFPPAMEEACAIVERVVNEQLKQRERFPLEWDGGTGNQNWRANIAASNCYEGSKEGVGFHSDTLTYLGPYPTIASLSLGWYS